MTNGNLLFKLLPFFYELLKMENLDFGRLKNILEIIKIANFTLDQNILRRKILDALSKILHIDSSIFILPDENSRGQSHS